ncbi:hypothetical protein ES703_70623 [subsurface metagenome]
MGIGKGVAKEARSCPFLVLIVTSTGDCGVEKRVSIRGFSGVRSIVLLRSVLSPCEKVHVAEGKLAVARICNWS